MSLRMNLYGWAFEEFRQILGSGNAEVLDRASSLLAGTLQDELPRSRGLAWLRTLVEDRVPLRGERLPVQPPADGGLLTKQMENEVHAIAVDCLRRAIARGEHLDLATASSNWSHPAVGHLHRELRDCEFSRSENFDRRYWSWISGLSKGSPLFGDEFDTAWSFYTVFSAEDVDGLVPLLRAAVDYERTVPAYIPKGQHPTGLSPAGKEFATALGDWFEQIRQAGQEPFIIWW